MALHMELVKQKILPGGSVVTGVVTALSDDLEATEADFKSEDAAYMGPVNPSSPKDPLLAIRWKEFEVELSRQQYQSQVLPTELETQKIEFNIDVFVSKLIPVLYFFIGYFELGI